MARNELRLMEAAVAVGEELSFARAAYRLGITQPAVTKQIAELENRLGVVLFDRDRRRVILNDVGRAYLEEARLAVLHADRAIQAIRVANENAETVLRVGRSPNMDPFLISVLLSLQVASYPRLRVELQTRFVDELSRDLETGVLDLAFLTEPTESLSLTKVKVSEEPFYIAVLGEDRLSTYPSIRVEQLAERSWILFERLTHPTLYERLMSLAAQRNASPSAVHHFMAAEEAYALLVENQSVAWMTKANAISIARTGVALRPVQEPALCISTYLASRSDNKSKAVSKVVRAFMREVRSADITETPLFACFASPTDATTSTSSRRSARRSVNSRRLPSRSSNK